jgi:CHASE3 domain sensor protein
MFNFVISLILKSKNFAIGFAIIIVFLIVISFVDNYFEAQDKVKEYERIEQETKEFHQEKIQELKETLKKRNNAKKIDYNESGNLDDDFLLKSLE